MMTKLNPTDEEFIAAIEKNGYKKVQGTFITFKKDGSVRQACAVGQALLNLGVEPKAVKHGTYKLTLRKHYKIRKDILWDASYHQSALVCPKCGLERFSNLHNLAVHINDVHKGVTVKRIGKYLREALANAGK